MGTWKRKLKAHENITKTNLTVKSESGIWWSKLVDVKGRVNISVFHIYRPRMRFSSTILNILLTFGFIIDVKKLWVGFTTLEIVFLLQCNLFPCYPCPRVLLGSSNISSALLMKKVYWKYPSSCFSSTIPIFSSFPISSKKHTTRKNWLIYAW